jgi:prophage antirepressor-like protein
MENSFKYQDITVRTITDANEETWFSGVDVCNILGYSMGSNVIKENLEEDERKLTNLRDRSGQQRKTWIINEFGLYSLILSSSKPEAKAFKRWITHEVLPSIRKAGKYTTNQEKSYSEALLLIADGIYNLKREKDDYQAKINVIKKLIETRTDEMFKLIKTDRNQLQFDFDNTALEQNKLIE